MRRTVFLLTLLILTAGVRGNFAQTGRDNCSIQAYVTDTNPEGIIVRRRPAAAAQTLAKLQVEYGDTALPAIIVKVIGYADGWVKISRAQKLTGELAFSPKVSSTNIFSGTGWISAEVLAVRTQARSKADNPVPLFAGSQALSRKSGAVPNDYPVKIAGFRCG